MDGSITQLNLTNYLINNNNPAVSFFKHTYKNYTNFAKDTRELNFKNGINLQTIKNNHLEEKYENV